MVRLTREREAQGLTRAELGARAKVHPARVGQMELGRLRPPPDSVELERIADALMFEDEPRHLLDVVA